MRAPAERARRPAAANGATLCGFRARVRHGRDMGMPVTLIPKAAEQLLKELSIPYISVSPRVLWRRSAKLPDGDGYIPLA